jgi:hypothetical protein
MAAVVQIAGELREVLPKRTGPKPGDHPVTTENMFEHVRLS